MILADCHIHSFFSSDANLSIDDITHKARERHLEFFTISDHYEIWSHEGYTFHPEERCFFLLEKQKLFPGLLIGVEIGEPQENPSLLQKWQNLPFDLFLGSIHVVKNMFGPHSEGNFPDEEVYRAYFSEVKRMVETTEIDAVAHLDFPRRYLGSYFIPWEILDEILTIMIERQIALEINTSAWRKGISASMPDEAILRRYAELGGKRILTGSDAHLLDEVGDGIERAFHLARELGLTPGFYRKHEFIPLVEKE
ncbi:PHP domain-containing protein [Thermospira aquatica]|uniref:Histidinol-phosphatase n=1 Tax=Thermospira aquatica TaxID=2828656 RepID=A0AAX3BFK2_9SPIR|nr:PHP domain-containing protein [Thermospira aquatica]URA11021.1 hypothetical protein KDW03_04250 [Thermospira aquatica]